MRFADLTAAERREVSAAIAGVGSHASTPSRTRRTGGARAELVLPPARRLAGPSYRCHGCGARFTRYALAERHVDDVHVAGARLEMTL